MADTIKTNLGPVTAYADAKAHGYTGTREEFGQLLAGAAGNLQDAVAAKVGAEAAKQSAETAQKAAAENQKNAGTQAANAKASADTAAEQADFAKESATGAANSASAAQESETNAGLSATAAANAEAAAKQAQNAAETAKADAEAAQTAAGNSADAAANSAADAKRTLESIPADYSALSGKVDENTSGIRKLKEDIALITGTFNPTWTSGQYVSATTGAVISYDAFSTCTFNVNSFNYFKMQITTALSGNAGICFYTKNNKYISSVPNTSSAVITYITSIPNNADHVTISCATSKISIFNLKYTDVYNGVSALLKKVTNSDDYIDYDTITDAFDAPVNTYLSFSSRSRSVKNAPNNAKNFSMYLFGSNKSRSNFFGLAVLPRGDVYYAIKWSTINPTWIKLNGSDYTATSSVSMFESVGVIGDSFASGEITAVSQHDYYNKSWIQDMARRNGFTATNYSRGGLTARAWLRSEYGLQKMKSDAPLELYICALGINDAGLGDSYLGTVNDISTGADTFYGNYGTIIKSIMAHAPKAKILIMDMAEPNNTATKLKFNNAIHDIASTFNLPLLIESNSPFFNSTFYTKRPEYHPYANLYAGMSVAIEEMINKALVTYSSYFNTFPD